MKLLTKTALLFVTIALFTLFACGIMLYEITISLVQQKVDTELRYNIEQAVDYLEHSDTSKKLVYPNAYVELVSGAVTDTLLLYDTILLDKKYRTYKQYRAGSYTTTIHNQWYKITVFQLLIDDYELVERIALAILLLVVVFLLGSYIFARFFFKRVWNDFFDSVEKVKHFDITKNDSTVFKESEIEEINQLNKTLQQLTGRVRKDYENLDEFTGNISHEIQTPLAIIQSKTDMLLQDEQLTDKQLATISDIRSVTVRLSKLNETLVLMAKIAGNHFPNREDVDLKNIIQRHLTNLTDVLDAKQLTLTTELQSCIVNMNAQLADVLIVNLLKNAIRHNKPNGFINIVLTQTNCIIVNSGIPLHVPTSDTFIRFNHQNNNPESLGIGLALVKKIADFYQIDISYTNLHEKHHIELSFRKN